MTDFELMTLFNDSANTTINVLTIYISIVFAFLIAGYFVSNKLKPAMVIIVITLYTIASGFLCFSINRFVTNTANIGYEIQRLVAEGQSTLTWTTIANDKTTSLVMMPAIVTFVVILSYVGSLIFFFYQRKEGLKA